ncbi:unnamed protein product [Ectocarpus sp. CCAP 1310/34]|nr:unnamed protein product [Ectocarpus sp. CCAP 1310/34]
MLYFNLWGHGGKAIAYTPIAPLLLLHTCAYLDYANEARSLGVLPCQPLARRRDDPDVSWPCASGSGGDLWGESRVLSEQRQ